MPSVDNVFCPIIYVRGFAMSQGEIDETTADPFCGFNIGSTVFRATPDKQKQPRKFIFESPLVRLSSDFGYTDVYEDGQDVMDDDWDGAISRQSVIIYRYYDSASSLLGDEKDAADRGFREGFGQAHTAGPGPRLRRRPERNHQKRLSLLSRCAFHGRPRLSRLFTECGAGRR